MPVPRELKREQLRALDAGRQPKALEIWEELSSCQADPMVSSCGASSLQRAGRWQEALRILQRLQKPWDATALSTAASCHAQKEECSQTRQVLQEMTRRKLTLDDRALRAGIEASTATLDWQESLKLLEQMEDEDAEAMGRVMTTLSTCQQWAQALDLCRKKQQQGVLIDVATSRTVAQLLGVHGQWQPLQEIFGNLERRQALGGWWNAKVLDEQRQQRTEELSAAICSARWQDALSLWQEMKSERLEPQPRVFAPLLLASCASSWQDALQMLEEVKQRGHVPSNEALSGVVIRCAAARQWQEALQLLRQLRGKGSAAAYAALINALPKDQPQLVAEVFAEMKSRPSWAMARPESGTEAAEHAASCAGSAEVEQVARMDPERR